MEYKNIKTSLNGAFSFQLKIGRNSNFKELVLQCVIYSLSIMLEQNDMTKNVCGKSERKRVPVLVTIYIGVIIIS